MKSRPGSPPMPLALSASIATVTALAAFAVLVAGSEAARRTTESLLPLVALVVVIGVVARLVTIRIRIGGYRLCVDWTEAGVVLMLAVSPVGTGWMVLAAGFGMLVADLVKKREPVKVVFNVAVAVLSMSAAVLVFLGLRTLISSAPADIVELVFMGAAAITAWFVNNALTAVAVGLSHGESPIAAWRDSVAIHAMVMFGNIAIALGLYQLAKFQPWCLLAAPPVMWLVHQGYLGRARAGSERRMWKELAAATRTLNQLDEHAVLTAAVNGATKLFSADSVEIELRRGPRDLWLARGDGSGELQCGKPGAQVRTEQMVIPTPLVHDNQPLGELRLCFAGQLGVEERDRLALSTFAGSLAAALSNAAAHARLGALAERRQFEATHDLLTGLVNRQRLIELAGERRAKLVAANRMGSLAVLVCGVNHFKEVNDALGRAAGDALLMRISDRLSAGLNEPELLARLDGDEFAVLLDVLPGGDLGWERAQKRATVLQELLAEPIVVHGVALAIEASIGVATTSMPRGCELSELLRRANMAMHEAKRTGRSLSMYSPECEVGGLDRLALAADLRVALTDTEQLFLELQPSIDLRTGLPIGAEALVRWRHPRRGLLNPSQFIPIIERTELVRPFTRYVLDLALTVCASWAAQGAEVPIAVNLSARSLLDHRLPDDLMDLLGKHRVHPRQLVLEITETVMMSELEVVEEVLAALRDIGVQIAVDDFGTGYSSLTFLAHVRVDEVKIDQSFVCAMITSREAAAIVQATVALARGLGVRVIAEGVETREQYAELRRLGCTAAQGFGLHPPLSVDAATAVIEGATPPDPSHLQRHVG